ncbi:MAG: ribonuclease [Patescibacteria group bacterium]|nr:ribonuclease [Patescibacteria group bacterium]
MILPTLEYEQNLWRSGTQYVAGVDEVGRGALAGPVVAAAVVFDCKHVPILGVRDSKTLSPLQKNRFSADITSSCLAHGIGAASASEIDTIGIVAATALAMKRALEKLAKTDHLLIDGLPFKEASLLSQYQKTFIVKGDSKSYSIAGASILAKVYRDTYMKKLAELHPHYLWQNNVGYGTKKHLENIKEYGPTEYHRLSFLQ